MDDLYKPLYKQAAALQQQFHNDTLATAHDPTAMILRNEIHSLTNDIATSRNPRTIEARVHMIEQQLRRSEINNKTHFGETPIMGYNHSNAMLHSLEGMRMNVRQHPHY